MPQKKLQNLAEIISLAQYHQNYPKICFFPHYDFLKNSFFLLQLMKGNIPMLIFWVDSITAKAIERV